MQKYVLSTIMGVESLAKKEVERQGWKIEEVVDRLVTFSGGPEMIPRMNYWSRVGNKMYILLAEEDNIDTFDKLFDTVNEVNWKKYFKKDFPIMVKATSLRSDLWAVPTIQGVSKKAIAKSLAWGTNKTILENNDLEKMGILILLVDNKLRVLLDTTGKALHMRWYRLEAWEAPIKESLAAACILLSNWRFKDAFYDPFCGSGTFAIEALMIARNIAPGLNRRFAFEDLELVDSEIIQNEIESAKSKSFQWEYKVFASDIDPEMIEIAKANAKRAGQDDSITFEVKDFKELALETWLSGMMVTNPPYDIRLKDDNIGSLYKNIDRIFRMNPELKWGPITGYAEFDDFINLADYKKRKLYNGGELCYFYRRK